MSNIIAINFLHQAEDCYHPAVADCSSNPNYLIILLAGGLGLLVGWLILVKIYKKLSIKHVLLSAVVFCLLLFTAQMLEYERMKVMEGIVHEWNSSPSASYFFDNYIVVLNSWAIALAAMISSCVVFLKLGTSSKK